MYRSLCILLIVSGQNLFALSPESHAVLQQATTVKGRVTDESGSPLPGANVVIKGSTLGVVTDMDGYYSIAVPDKQSVLVISYVGYTPYETPVGDRTAIDAVLTEDLAMMDEVLVIGYGTESRRNVISSISSVGGKELESKPVVNIEQALTGKIPGVSIMQSNGAPGGGMTVNIRGAGSITGGTAPLYVIDGLPLSTSSGDSRNQGNNTYNYSTNPLNAISPNDIASIQVLKDAAATAIYGSRGSNGVVLITTKSGSYGDRFQVSFNAWGGFAKLAKKVPVMNAYELSNYMKSARDLSWIAKDPSKNKADDPLEWRNIDDRYPSYILPYVQGQPGLTDTDWQDEFYRTAKVSNYEISVSGGTGKLRTFISANYMNQEGIIPNSGIERIGLRVNLESALHERVRIGVNVSPAFINNNLAQSEKNWGDEGLVIGTLMQHPQLPAYNGDGSYAVDRLYEVMWSGESNVVQFQNPLALANMVDNRMMQSRIIAGAHIEVDILDGLSFKSAFGSDINYNSRYYYRPKLLSHRLEKAPTTYYNYGTVFNSNYFNILWDNTLEYTKRFNNVHSLKAVLGNSVQKEINKNATAEGRNFATDNIRTINTAQERYSNEYRREWSLLSYFSRLTYNYKDRYMLSATVRADGSSKFGKDSKWGVFPSVSAGWRLSDEAFFRNDVVDDLKLRASYGLTGNNDIPYYGAIALLSTDGKYPIGNVVQSGLYPGSSPNTNLSWETTRTVDAGVDVSFLKHFTFGVDYYHSNTTDLLLNVPVPSSSGYSSSLQNIGELENRGVEILLGSDFMLFGGNFSASVNFSANRNKVLALGPGQEQIISNGGFTASHITRVGHPVGSFFGYEVTGKFETAEQLASTPQYGKQAIGDFIYRNTNNDSVIDADDRVILGDNYPDYQVGLNLGYQLKGFDLSVSAYTSRGGKIINTMHRYLAEAWGNNLSVYLSDKAPRPVWGVGSASHTRPSSWQIEDGSYLRIREIIVGYTIPGKLTGRLKLNSVRIYASLLNPFTWTDYSGYNPEVSSNYGNPLTPGEEFGNYPVSKTTTFGINMSF